MEKEKQEKERLEKERKDKLEKEKKDIKEKLWKITPLTKMWGISFGYEAKLNAMGIETVGQLANTDKNLLKEIFGCLFTPNERRDFAERWQLVKELKAGTTQREIARKYNMSLCKITRGSKELQKPDSAFQKMLEMIEK